MKILETLENKFLSARTSTKFLLGLVKPQSNETYKDRTLSFEDNFDLMELDRKKWNTEFPWGRQLADAWMTDGLNLEFKDSIAKFVVKYEPGVKIGWWGTHNYNYTISHINTLGKFEQKYGRFEAKCKVKNIRGLFPAFWMLTPVWIHPDAPGNGDVIMPEIDIFEHFDRGFNKTIGANYHHGLSYEKPWHKSNGTDVKLVDFSKDFHVYAVEWTMEKIEWFIDGEKFKVLYFKNYNEDEIAHRKMYLIINDAVDGNRLKKNHDKLPDGMEVDWVRVYK